MSLNSMKVRNALTLKPNTAPTNPENGDIYYDSGSNSFQFYANGGFVAFATTTLNNLGTTAANASIIPVTTAANLDLGGSGQRWRNLYLNNGIMDGNGNVAVSTANKNLRDNGNVISLNWSSRILNDTAGATQLSWATTGVTVSTALLPGADASIDAGSATFRWANIRSLNYVMYGSSSGTLTHSVPSTVTSYTITWPGAQAIGTQVLQNTGGTLSWATAVTGSTYRSGTTAISNASSSQAVTFSSTLGTTSYGVVAVMSNITDSTPQYQPITITSISATGFTASWNEPTDTANYSLQWIVFLNN